MNISQLNKGLIGKWDFNVDNKINKGVRPLSYIPLGDKLYDVFIEENVLNTNDPIVSGGTVFNIANSASYFPNDGSLKYVEYDDASYTNFERTDKFSFSVWFMKTETNQGTVLQNYLNGEYKGYNLQILTNNTIQFSMLQNASSSRISVVTSSAINLDQWYLLVVTYNGTSNASGVTMYLNSVPTSLTIQYDALGGSIISSQPQIIGLHNQKGTFPFGGYLSEIKVYDRELTQEDVDDLYTFKFQDKSGNNNPLVNNGMTFTTNKWGEENKAIDLSLGTSLRTSNDNISFMGDLTISFWYLPYPNNYRAYRHIFSKGTGGISFNSFPYFGFYEYYGPGTISNRLEFRWNSYDTRHYTIYDTYNKPLSFYEQWNMVTLVKDRTNNNLKIYWNDGDLWKNGSKDITNVPEIDFTQYFVNITNAYSKISNINVWNRAFTPQEISNLYNFKSNK